MPLNGDPSKLRVFLERLTEDVSMLAMRFVPLKCKTLLQEWTLSKLDLVHVEEQVYEVDRFRYLSSCTSPGGGRIAEEVPSQKVFIVIHQFEANTMLA